MEFKIVNDDDVGSSASTGNSSGINPDLYGSSEKDSFASAESTSAPANPYPGTPSAEPEKPVDDFSDLEDTVYIANRYNINQNTTSTFSEPIRSSAPKTPSYILLIISTICFAFGYFALAATYSSLFADASAGMEPVSLSTTFFAFIARILLMAGGGFLLADAIKMTVLGYGASLIPWAILFAPIYYFKRAKAVCDSAVVGLIFLACVTIPAVIMFFSMYNGGKQLVSTATSDGVAEVMDSAEFEYDGHTYSYGDIFKTNIENLTYETESSNGKISKIIAKGSTDVYGGISQPITITITDSGIESIQFGVAEPYTDQDRIGKIMVAMINKTKPKS